MRSHKLYSVESILPRLILFAIPVILASIALSIYALYEIRTQSISYITTYISDYHTVLKKNLDAIQEFSEFITTKDSDLENLDTSDQPYETYVKASLLRSRAKNFQALTGEHFQYIYYNKAKDIFYNLSNITMTYEDYIGLQTYARTSVENRQENRSWKIISINSEPYLYYYFTYQNRIFISTSKVKDLLAPLHMLDIGKHGIVQVLGEENTLFEKWGGWVRKAQPF
ncbi:MAG: hypothetical protein IJ733_14665 [Lachnospiraceae bacterium]|nr:hypothetical protein [Lachnospiraceae bacterium]